MTLSDWVPMTLLSLFRTIYYDSIPNICTLTFSSESKFRVTIESLFKESFNIVLVF